MKHCAILCVDSWFATETASGHIVSISNELEAFDTVSPCVTNSYLNIVRVQKESDISKTAALTHVILQVLLSLHTL